MNLCRRLSPLSHVHTIFSSPTVVNSAVWRISHKRNMTEARHGFFYDMYVNMAESKMVLSCQDLILQVHDATGLPWGATIVAVSVLARAAITLPLAVHQRYVFAKLSTLKPEMDELAKEVAAETRALEETLGLTKPQAAAVFKRAMKRHRTIIIERENCHPAKGFMLILVQVPLWISLSFSIRNFIELRPRCPQAIEIFNDFSVQGFGWISNLTIPDKTLIIPVLFGLINLSIIEIQAMMAIQPIPKRVKFIMNLTRGFSLFMVPLSAMVPSGLSLYWMTSSAFGLFQNLLLLSPKVKNMFRIPITKFDVEKPYTHIKNQTFQRLKNVLTIFKNKK